MRVRERLCWWLKETHIIITPDTAISGVNVTCFEHLTFTLTSFQDVWEHFCLCCFKATDGVIFLIRTVPFGDSCLGFLVFLISLSTSADIQSRDRLDDCVLLSRHVLK